MTKNNKNNQNKKNKKDKKNKKNKNPHPLVHRAASAGPHLSCPLGRRPLSGGKTNKEP